MKSLITIILASFAAMAWATASVETDLGGMTISMPKGFAHIIGQGLDSTVGKIQSVDGGISISYDIGPMAGVQARPPQAGDAHKTFWFREGKIGGTPVLTTLHGYNDGRLILYVSFPKLGPANFYTEVKDAEHARRLETLIYSFQPKEKAARRPF